MDRVVDRAAWIGVACAIAIAGCAGGHARTGADAERAEATRGAVARQELPAPNAAPSVAEPPVAVAPERPVETPPEPVALRDPLLPPPSRPLPPPGAPTVASSGAPSGTPSGAPSGTAPARPPAPPPPPAPPDTPVLSADVCPVGIPGLAVRAVNAAGGAALVMTADPDHVRALRERMERFAQLQAEARRAHEGRTAESPTQFGDQDAPIHQATVTAVATPDGVRLVARAERPADVRALREELREDAEALSRGACPLALEIVS